MFSFLGMPPKNRTNQTAPLQPCRHDRDVLVRIPHDERREAFLEIFTRKGSGERLVTTIEVLSPANKTPGEHGRDLYLRKQAEILESKVHLVEIDLLRGGVHSTAVPHHRAVEESGPFDYHVCVHTFDQWEDFLVYPVRLDERLPEIAIPLLPGDPPVIVDLQEIFDRAYEVGPYRRRIRYHDETPVPALTPEQSEWAKGILRQKGLLPTA